MTILHIANACYFPYSTRKSSPLLESQNTENKGCRLSCFIDYIFITFNVI